MAFEQRLALKKAAIKDLVGRVRPTEEAADTKSLWWIELTYSKESNLISVPDCSKRGKKLCMITYINIKKVIRCPIACEADKT